MKKILLVIVFLLVGWRTSAQSVDVNVRSRDGRVKLHFGHSHEWMVGHGYRYYHPGGYYVRRGVRVYPTYRTYHGNKYHGWAPPHKHYKKHPRHRGHGRGHRHHHH